MTQTGSRDLPGNGKHGLGGAKILIVDDEPDLLASCDRILGHVGALCHCTTDPHKALTLVKQIVPDVILVDLRMPRMDGFAFLKEVRKEFPSQIVVMMTAFANVRTALEATRLGAFDYLTKPFPAEELRVVLGRGMAHAHDLAEGGTEAPAEERKHDFSRILGESAPMRQLIDLAARVCASDASTVLVGESGTGKELLATCLHVNSPRASGPFISVDCSAIPETIFESELFGHEKGAFTGATDRRIGLFEQADKGTLFLDEVTNMSESVQVKLLRVLQERHIRRLGGRSLIPVDFRLVVASTVELKELVDSGRFRSDLYYRLNVVTLRIPPLRHRVGDVKLLARTFFQEFSSGSKPELLGISASAEMILSCFDWPGNVRELRNVIQHAVCLSPGPYITPLELPAYLVENAANEREQLPPLLQSAKQETVESFEKEFISDLLKRTRGNVSRAASLAGMHRSAFQRILRRHGIVSEAFR
jgi:DNA-binding NtrC family response regulator